jgi:glucose-6-phosphate isomerase
MIPLTETPVWSRLATHQHTLANVSMRALFRDDPTRFDSLSVDVDGLLLDYSKNRITAETMALLTTLAHERNIEKMREAMFSGQRINPTENRSALHCALRSPPDTSLTVDGMDVIQDVLRERQHMRVFSDSVRRGEWRGHTGLPITDVVNIGIGGSDLGPAMVCEALAPYASPDLRLHFVSNVDGAHFARTTASLDSATTLFIIASKTFTTLETMTNAHTARRWFLERCGDETAIKRHFVAVSTNTEAVTAFGIDTENMFRFWDWVGGRYSLWSSIGLSIALAVGMDRFEELLTGAHRMDRHFVDAEPGRNMPIILALLGVWYHNFFGAHSHVVVPYDQNLSRFPAYLQQLDMESNGKGVDRDGEPVTNYTTGPIVWGESGCSSQHSFFQLLHQGTRLAPVDFLIAARSHYPLGDHHQVLIASCLAQSQALMLGRTEAEARTTLELAGLDQKSIEQRLPHCVFPGNRPSNTLAYSILDPHTLGMLIALYEHKVFVQGIIWNINSFDQFGVELGKELAGTIAGALDGRETGTHDASTDNLIAFLTSRDARGSPE